VKYKLILGVAVVALISIRAAIRMSNEATSIVVLKPTREITVGQLAFRIEYFSSQFFLVVGVHTLKSNAEAEFIFRVFVPIT
jgi:hypothetical protein